MDLPPRLKRVLPAILAWVIVASLLLGVATNVYHTVRHYTTPFNPDDALNTTIGVACTTIAYALVLGRRGYGSAVRWAYLVVLGGLYVLGSFIAGLKAPMPYHYGWRVVGVDSAVFLLVSLPLVHWLHTPVKPAQAEEDPG